MLLHIGKRRAYIRGPYTELVILVRLIHHNKTRHIQSTFFKIHYLLGINIRYVVIVLQGFWFLDWVET